LATKWLIEKLKRWHVGLMSAPSEISLNDAVRILSDTAHKSWQLKCNEENTGWYTYNLIPKVGTKVIFPQERDIQ